MIMKVAARHLQSEERYFKMYNEDYMNARKRCGRVNGACPIGAFACNTAAQQTRCDMPQKAQWGLENYPLASVYAPLQSFCELYELETALEKGTLFKQLDLPFWGSERPMKGGSCRG